MRNSLIQILLRFAVVDGGPMLQDEAESTMDVIQGALRCDRCKHFILEAEDCFHAQGMVGPEPEDFCSRWEQR